MRPLRFECSGVRLVTVTRWPHTRVSVWPLLLSDCLGGEASSSSCSKSFPSSVSASHRPFIRAPISASQPCCALGSTVRNPTEWGLCSISRQQAGREVNQAILPRPISKITRSPGVECQEPGLGAHAGAQHRVRLRGDSELKGSLALGSMGSSCRLPPLRVL